MHTQSTGAVLEASAPSRCLTGYAQRGARRQTSASTVELVESLDPEPPNFTAAALTEHSPIERSALETGWRVQDGGMSTPEPVRPDMIETVLYEPDQQRMLAVLPGPLWLSPGDFVELDEPPRDARVLSTRLQLLDGRARVLVVLDVPDDGESALRGDVATEVILNTELDEPVAGLSAELDRDLAALEGEPRAAPEPGSSPT